MPVSTLAPPQKGYDKNVQGFMAERDEIRAQASRIERAFERQQMSEAERDRNLADLEQRLNDLASRFEAWDTQAQKGLEAFGGNR